MVDMKVGSDDNGFLMISEQMFQDKEFQKFLQMRGAYEVTVKPNADGYRKLRFIDVKKIVIANKKKEETDGSAG